MVQGKYIYITVNFQFLSSKKVKDKQRNLKQNLLYTGEQSEPARKSFVFEKLVLKRCFSFSLTQT